jgi:hypothetical protein
VSTLTSGGGTIWKSRRLRRDPGWMTVADVMRDQKQWDPGRMM